MLLCEYSEEQILSHFRQILKKDYPQKGRKALLADLREASRIRKATPPEEWPALLLDILRASGWFPAAVREILDQIERLPANASRTEVARIVSAARKKMKARKVSKLLNPNFACRVGVGIVNALDCPMAVGPAPTFPQASELCR
jgi:hypothetical protein